MTAPRGAELGGTGAFGPPSSPEQCPPPADISLAARVRYHHDPVFHARVHMATRVTEQVQGTPAPGTHGDLGTVVHGTILMATAMALHMHDSGWLP